MKAPWLIPYRLTLLTYFCALVGCLPVTPVSDTPIPTLTFQPTTIPTETVIPENTSQPSPTEITTSLRPLDGMTMVQIPPGKFLMGSEEGEPDEGPVHEVYLDAFWIDQTEVTTAMYALCVEAGACMPPVDTSSYSRMNYFGDSQYANYPVIFVDWDMANTYCEWAGARLPTEAEWEKAARGESARVYPWGDTWDVQAKRRLNFADKNNPETTSDINADDGYGDTAPVGSYEAGKSPYGVYDLAGNVWEWVADWYDPLYYRASPTDNPQGPAVLMQEISQRVLRGGSWVAANQDVFHTSNRNGLKPSQFSSSIGFRCARSAD